MHAGCGEEAMSAAEMEAHVAVKGDEEAFHHQRAQAHQHAAQAAKKSKERRSAVFGGKRRTASLPFILANEQQACGTRLPVRRRRRMM